MYDYRRHALDQRTVGAYAVIPPDGYDDGLNAKRRYPLCILLHGQGSNERRLVERMFPSLRVPGVFYLAPRAPHPHHDAFIRGEPGFRAWPMTWSEWGEPGYPREDVLALDVARLYTEWIARCVDDVVRRYRIRERKLIIVGHSEGATYAHAFAAHYPTRVARYFAYAGGPYDPTLGDETCALEFKRNGVIPLIAHCRRDAMNRFEGSAELAAYLQAHDVRHVTFFPDDAEHDFTALVLERAKGFLNEWLRSRNGT
ncbi:MAG: hypothetical protein P8Y95_11220 [Gammaproteobacteria bacterium]